MNNHVESEVVTENFSHMHDCNSETYFSSMMNHKFVTW